MIRIGTRGSALALWQAREVARRIGESGGPPCEIAIIRTSGDETAGPPDAPEPGAPAPNVKRLFVKEIEDALIDGRVDLAVHSGKDLPADLPDGLALAASLAREDPRDALVLPAGTAAADLAAVRRTLGESPRIGTSSVRRAAQLAGLFPRARFVAIRGNVDTRLGKLDEGECDALVLAAAGLTRLGLDARITMRLSEDTCVPAPGQGIVAVETKADDGTGLAGVLSRISDADAWTALVAERAVVRALGASCQMPLGVLATLDGQDLQIAGLVSARDGHRAIRALAHGQRGSPAAAGEKLAALLLERGAAALLAQ